MRASSYNINKANFVMEYLTNAGSHWQILVVAVLVFDSRC